ncbi:spore coat putative kinase YutH [Rossellomorea vietnamensis]|uniref:Spore coat protein YutH n=1 Tax=Rossellomorea vietnamensis TaxID=218284 RepID=A0ACD4C7U3_9BACI|nr:spore coat protein YutH [Rossellomorea vietnamensis]UXH43662.1 spore coat protein YutH [Rossellomorea vietnamensis]WQI95022.1 spore coat protein YutH [Rossellomorea vietnamensis]
MSQEILINHFGLHPERAFFDGMMDRYMVGGLVYSIVGVSNMEQETLVELYKLAEHLKSTGDRHVSTFVQSHEGKFLVVEKDKDYVVLRNEGMESPPYHKLGRKLSKFHFRGRTFEEKVEKINRMGQWKSLWEKRMAQLEKAYYQVIQDQPADEFERRFVESYPYYSALSENAIQYLVDTELDEDPKAEDAGTICHERFLDSTWGTEMCIHFPFQWVFDHCSRDIAEWVRERYFMRSQTFHPELQEFMKEYESVTPLSPFAWRLLYSRLLFPLHYFECIEEYYISQSEQEKKTVEEKLERYLKNSHQYEAFLADFYHMSEVPVKKWGIPLIAWL